MPISWIPKRNNQAFKNLKALESFYIGNRPDDTIDLEDYDIMVRNKTNRKFYSASPLLFTGNNLSTFQQVLTAGSTLTTNNTIGINPGFILNITGDLVATEYTMPQYLAVVNITNTNTYFGSGSTEESPYEAGIGLCARATGAGLVGIGTLTGVRGEGINGVFGTGTDNGVYGTSPVYGLRGVSTGSLYYTSGVYGTGKNGVWGLGSQYGIHGESQGNQSRAGFFEYHLNLQDNGAGIFSPLNYFDTCIEIAGRTGTTTSG